MSDPKKVLQMIKENDVKYVDLRFTDPRGKWQHLAHAIETINEDTFTDGIMFDGSSIAGWKAINESDMVLMPDAETAVMDPFAAQPSLVLFCDVYEPGTGQPYGRDPRSIAKKAEGYLKSSGIGDTAYFGPEIEFFVFDDVRYKVGMNVGMYEIDSEEGPYVSDKKYEEGNMGHRPPIKGGYFPVPPVDGASDLRAEMLTVMKDMGLKIEKHHHEVAPSQHELGNVFSTLVKAADGVQIYKYVVHNVAHQYGKTATFMPKPIKGDNGSGMHTHQSIWKKGKPLFAGNLYADLSETALFYIGGIIKHAKAINCFTNPLTNSYKRLIPGFEAPVLLAYSARNRSASCRIPYVASPKGKRVEVRFPDPGCNPYLGFAAMLMAGLDGIRNKIHPGDAIDKNLYDLPPDELKKVPTVCGSLREAITHLENDHEFLMGGDVFGKDFLQSYMDLKWEEVYAFEHTPHPIEFQMYYSV
ncbi:MAG TPA: type I glutamate--ammonia ligase [Alphaproteobacteria bacterium]|nr:type I glutamate--ammonia ligase [Alphaproteobacteria bacterium]